MDFLAAAAKTIGKYQWPHAPHWFQGYEHIIIHFIAHNQALGIFLVIFAEELGIPLPVPGDVTIAFAGYLTTIGKMSYFAAYMAVIFGAVTGSFLLLNISRRLSRVFISRFGIYFGLEEERMKKAEQAFRRWGPWTIIIGRQIPGMRVIITVLSGTLKIPARVFVPCVLISSAIWAITCIELGRRLGRHVRALFHLIPAHLLPLLLIPLVLLIMTYMVYEHLWRPHRKALAKQQKCE